MSIKRIFSALICAVMLAGVTACEKEQEPEAFYNQGIDQTDPNNSNDNNSESDEGLNGHEAVDLGLPSGLLWATCNVGATSPELSGYYFAWGETTPKADYLSSNYTYSNNPTTLPLSADAAHVNWGGAWRMPTEREFGELLAYCSWLWVTQNEANGYKVTGQNGNSIFLPAAGYRDGSSLDYYGSCGYYWSSLLDTSYPSYAYYLYFNSSGYSWRDSSRYYGRSVRAVCKK